MPGSQMQIVALVVTAGEGGGGGGGGQGGGGGGGPVGVIGVASGFNNKTTGSPSETTTRHEKHTTPKYTIDTIYPERYASEFQ